MTTDRRHWHERSIRCLGLCLWLGEDDVAWWHELDAGFGGRKPLIELT
jgi:hypothetical protein